MENITEKKNYQYRYHQIFNQFVSFFNFNNTFEKKKLSVT